ncbi:CRISPR-associated protein Cmr1 [Stigmatella aurantiaca]|uniref:CRISPR-associated protein Cmr1 n=1 Tax=Stigmatella aurantiaca TaxID=41 RepID=A0A1H7L9T1_STIAU|nr:type III-B CRISPR module RAMP protein Cmr1 [Stigmatella aurantiaca]SEK95699.1 CRISPR-associated protein Cmr1 [Stigmatella aurantiaca]
MEQEPPEPEPKKRRYLGAPEVGELHVHLKSVTPILGGAVVPRQVDTVDIIRVPTIRGHLRFWWRALYAHQYPSSQELAQRERDLWGGIGANGAKRSQVELRVAVNSESRKEDPSDIGQTSKGAYALWPARAMTGKGRGEGQPPAPRLSPGIRFQLYLQAPAGRLSEVENALRAWILWGGYGGRTRRGLGSLSVEQEEERWLPAQPDRAALHLLFGGLPLLGNVPSGGARQVPLMQGARLLHGRSEQTPEGAWLQALKWLKEFRQGQPQGRADTSGKFAREWGDPKRPGRSHWPEADKIRWLLKKRDGSAYAHAPRPEYAASGKVSWPRAGFGLPVAFRFQLHARPKPGERQDKAYANGEPEEVELRWSAGDKVHERLASPLIIKAMPLTKGRFVPVALWLCRTWPDKGEVVLTYKATRKRVENSAAPFHQLLAPGDTALYAPLREASLEKAFVNWLKSSQGAKEF